MDVRAPLKADDNSEEEYASASEDPESSAPRLSGKGRSANSLNIFDPESSRLSENKMKPEEEPAETPPAAAPEDPVGSGAAEANGDEGDGQKVDVSRFQSESELLRIRDLDSGKEIHVDKRFTIRDLTTGQLYVMDGGESSGAVTSASPPAAVKEGSRVTDLASGKELSLEEFDQALGLNHVLEDAKRRQAHGGHRRTASSELDEGAVVRQDARNVEGIGSAESGKAGGGKSGPWFKRFRFKGKGGSGSAAPDGSPRSHDSGDSSPLSSPTFSQMEELDAARREGSGNPGPSGRVPIKVAVNRKAYKELTDLGIVQELHAHAGVVWTMKFSHNGKYLATAGQDMVVRVWEVILHRGAPESPKKAAAENGAEPAAPAGGEESEIPPAGGWEGDCPVFRRAPHRLYTGHKQDVLDLCWSSSLFLLSASMDKTVRLWHISISECLRVFRHTDFVTSIDFHPVDDKYFLSGSIDGKVRIWNIPEQRVADWADVHEMVTAVVFSRDGRRAIVGTMKGKCRFYSCADNFKMEYQAQIDVKNKRGKQTRGRKITGLQFLPGSGDQLLITSNDSRVRLYDGYSLTCKFKGYHNRNTQIRATFSAGGDYIISGSDNGCVHIWTTINSYIPTAPASAGYRRDKNATYEAFHAHDDIVTCAIFAPPAARRQSYTGGQPSPVGALATGQLGWGSGGRLSKEEAEKAAGANKAAVAAARAAGQVLVTAGYSGEIKVFENAGQPAWL